MSIHLVVCNLPGRLSSTDLAFYNKYIKQQFTDNITVSELFDNDEIGYVGRELKKAVASSADEFVVLNSDVLTVDIQEIRNISQSNDCPVVMLNLKHSAEYIVPYSESFITYVDLNRLRSSLDAYIDWGSHVDNAQFDCAKFHQIGNIITAIRQPDESHIAYETVSGKLGQGWILVKTAIEKGLKVYNLPPDTDAIVCDDMVTVLDFMLRNTGTRSASVNTFLDNIVLEFSRQALNSIAEGSQYTSQQTPVENLYTRANNFDALMFGLAHSRDFRLIFFSEDNNNLENCRKIFELWDGYNQSSIGITEHWQNECTRLVDYHGSNFSTWFSWIKQKYIVYFNLADVQMIEDIETQCHVNNFVWWGDYHDNAAVRFQISSLRLYSTEIAFFSNGNNLYIEKIGNECYQQDLFKRFRLTYRNTLTGETLPTEYDILPHFTAQKWARCLVHDYFRKGTLVEKNYMLQHWEYDDNNPNARNKSALCREMNRYVNVINEYFDGSSEAKPKYEITQCFNPVTLDQQILNEIHHHFELLIGQVWSVSEWFKLADEPTRFAIRQLNNLCHEMESLCRPSFKNQKNWWVGVFFPYTKVIRYKFIESDYDHFTQYSDFGSIILHYSQLGKTPLEAYAARDEEVFDNNITGLRYLSGEFDISFQPDVPMSVQTQTIAKYNRNAFEWIRSRGQDPESKFTGIGFVHVAKFDRSLFPGLSAEQVMSIITETDDIYKLELIDANGNVVEESTLDYTWLDVLDVTDPTRTKNQAAFKNI